MVPLPHDEGRRTESRKKDHVDIILKEDVRARVNAWDDVALAHEALPEVDFERVDLATTFLGARLKAPVMIASMTGGYADAERINAHLAQAAAEHGLAMGVGSQRAGLLKPETRRSYEVVREHDVPFLAANIGAPQLVRQARDKLSRAEVEEVVKMVDADALIVHLNYLQEVAMPEGDLRAEGVEAAIRDLSRDLGVPVIAKETGAGLTRATAERLARAGASALDVGGQSGTTFAAVEHARAVAQGDAARARLGEVFRDWGVPTPVAVAEAARVGLPLVATGGLRHGLDAARAIAMGATLAGFASAALRAADKSAEDASAWAAGVAAELRAACFLTGSKRVADLAKAARVVTGGTRAWMDARRD